MTRKEVDRSKLDAALLKKSRKSRTRQKTRDITSKDSRLGASKNKEKAKVRKNK